MTKLILDMAASRCLAENTAFCGEFVETELSTPNDNEDEEGLDSSSKNLFQFNGITNV